MGVNVAGSGPTALHRCPITAAAQPHCPDLPDQSGKNHGAPFKIVHVGLGVVSVVLAALVWQIGAVALRSGRDGLPMEGSRA